MRVTLPLASAAVTPQTFRQKNQSRQSLAIEKEMSYPCALDDPDAQNMVVRPQLRQMISAILSEHNSEIEKLIRAGQIDVETGLAYCSNIADLKLNLSDVRMRG
jgi:hypothetical protein